MKTNCTACGADLTRPDAIRIIERLSASLEPDGKLRSPAPQLVTVDHLDEEDVECAECGELVRRVELVTAEGRAVHERAAVLEDCLVTLIVNMCQSRKMPLDKLVDVWEDSGIHHLMMHYVWPETDEQEGDEYARSIDAFENEIISRAEAILSRA